MDVKHTECICGAKYGFGFFFWFWRRELYTRFLFCNLVRYTRIHVVYLLRMTQTLVYKNFYRCDIIIMLFFYSIKNADFYPPIYIYTNNINLL